MAKSDITKLGKDVCWQDVTRGNTIVGSGTTREFITGDWTAVAPVIDEEKCRKCGLCAKQCPVGAIHGELGKVPYVIDQEKCIKCGQCIKACHFNVIERK